MKEVVTRVIMPEKRPKFQYTTVVVVLKKSVLTWLDEDVTVRTKKFKYSHLLGFVRIYQSGIFGGNPLHYKDFFSQLRQVLA